MKLPSPPWPLSRGTFPPPGVSVKGEAHWEALVASGYVENPPNLGRKKKPP